MVAWWRGLWGSSITGDLLNSQQEAPILDGPVGVEAECRLEVTQGHVFCFSLGHTSADLPAINFEVIVVAVGTILDVEVDEGDTESAEAIIQSADEVAAVESWKIAAWVTGAFDVELLEGVQSIAAGLPPGFRRFGTWIRLWIKEARGLRWWALVRATIAGSTSKLFIEAEKSSPCVMIVGDEVHRNALGSSLEVQNAYLALQLAVAVTHVVNFHEVGSTLAVGFAVGFQVELNEGQLDFAMPRHGEHAIGTGHLVRVRTREALAVEDAALVAELVHARHAQGGSLVQSCNSRGNPGTTFHLPRLYVEAGSAGGGVRAESNHHLSRRELGQLFGVRRQGATYPFAIKLEKIRRTLLVLFHVEVNKGQFKTADLVRHLKHNEFAVEVVRVATRIAQTADIEQSACEDPVALLVQRELSVSSFNVDVPKPVERPRGRGPRTLFLESTLHLPHVDLKPRPGVGRIRMEPDMFLVAAEVVHA